MAVAFDAVGPSSSGTQGSASPLTWSHVNGGNGILVGVTEFSGSTNNVTGITYGGVPLTFLGYVNSGNGGSSAGGVSLYGLVGGSVPAGSNTVSVSFSAANNHIAGSVSVSGAGSLGTPVSGFTSGNASTSLSVPGTTAGGLIVPVACFGSSGATFAGTNGVTVRWSKTNTSNSGSDNGVMGSVASAGGGASQTVGFSAGTSDDWGIVAVEVLPPAVNPGPPAGERDMPQRVVLLVSNSGWRTGQHSR